MAYDAFRTLFKRVTGQKRIDAAPTLAIGAAAGVVSSTATYPLEVIRKRMQVHCLAKLTWWASPPPFFPLFLLSRPPAFHGLPLSLPRFLSDRSFCQAFVDPSSSIPRITGIVQGIRVIIKHEVGWTA